MSMRDEFEKAVIAAGYDPVWDVDSYLYEDIQTAWEVWQADREQGEGLKARVAELESREDAMCDLSYANGAKHGFSLGQMGDGAGLDKCATQRMKGGAKELKRLRQQANEQEQK